MKKLIQGFTTQLKEALKIGRAVTLLDKDTDIRNVLITGMGGSGIGANLINSFAFNQIMVPITVFKGYDIPSFVNNHTLFIACSYSGNTEETVATLRKAMHKQAQIICITSGGEMLQLAKENNHSCIQLPAGYDSPRAMIGFMMVALLFSLHAVNLIESAFIKQIEDAIKYLDSQADSIQVEAEGIAKKLVGKLPIIYCDVHLIGVATRFQQQLNENAKQIAHVNTFPEMNHNEIEGWKFPENIIKLIQVIYLRSSNEHKRVKKRLEICREIFEKSSCSVIDISPHGVSILEQYLYLIHLTDWISYFVAKKNNVDPTEIEIINYLKSELDKIV